METTVGAEHRDSMFRSYVAYSVRHFPEERDLSSTTYFRTNLEPHAELSQCLLDLLSLVAYSYIFIVRIGL
jgi:hypothetical protein